VQPDAQNLSQAMMSLNENKTFAPDQSACFIFEEPKDPKYLVYDIIFNFIKVIDQYLTLMKYMIGVKHNITLDILC
jgi:hypothetical protein